jgi:hypothetical protein
VKNAPDKEEVENGEKYMGIKLNIMERHAG